MKILTRCIFLTLLSVVDSFISMPLIHHRIYHTTRDMAKYDFKDFAKVNSVSDKYFLINSLIKKVVLYDDNLLYDYCNKYLNNTDVMYVTLSRDLEYIIQKHHYKTTILELYDIIKENAKLTDCYINIHTLNSPNTTKIGL